MFYFGQRSRDNLIGVNRDLILVVSRGLLYSPIDFAVIEGVRNYVRQKELFESGASKTMRSAHLFGRAIDVMAVGDLNRDGVVDHKDKSIAWNREWYSVIADAMFKAAGELKIGIMWGGDWDGFFDGPHFELEAI